MGVLAFRAANQGLGCSFCCGTAGRGLAQQAVFVHRHRIYIYIYIYIYIHIPASEMLTAYASLATPSNQGRAWAKRFHELVLIGARLHIRLFVYLQILCMCIYIFICIYIYIYILMYIYIYIM